MSEHEWQQFLALLDEAERSLRAAASLRQDVGGLTPPGEHTFMAAVDSIGALRWVEAEFEGRLDELVARATD